MAAFEEISVVLQDGYEAYARFWPSAEPARAAVLYHHGIQSHCGWYEKSAAFLADAGYAVLQVDRRGSGRNEKQRGHAESADQLVDDAFVSGARLKELSSLSSYHVIGVSWGGKLAVAAYATNSEDVSSLTLVTPGLFPLVGVTKEEAAKIGFAMIYEPEQKFRIPLDDPKFFTKDPAWREFVSADPLTLRECTASFYLASRRMDRIVNSLGAAPAVPVHLLLAGEEHIVDNARTVAFLEDVDWPQTTISRHEQARHSLEFEGDSQVYYNQLARFLDSVG